MPNSVVVGRVRSIEPGVIILGGHLRIHVPAALSVAQFPIGASVTVLVHQGDDEQLIAESIELSKM